MQRITCMTSAANDRPPHVPPDRRPPPSVTLHAHIIIRFEIVIHIVLRKSPGGRCPGGRCPDTTDPVLRYRSNDSRIIAITRRHEVQHTLAPFVKPELNRQVCFKCQYCSPPYTGCGKKGPLKFSLFSQQPFGILI